GSIPGTSARTTTAVSLSVTSRDGDHLPHAVIESLNDSKGSRRNESNKRFTSVRNSESGDKRPSGVSPDLFFHGIKLIAQSPFTDMVRLSRFDLDLPRLYSFELRQVLCHSARRLLRGNPRLIDLLTDAKRAIEIRDSLFAPAEFYVRLLPR